MAFKNFFSRKRKNNGLKSYRRRKMKLNVPLITGILFIVAFICIFKISHNNIAPTQTYFQDSIDSSLPVIFQERSGRKINELRGYNDNQYNIVANETYTLLENERGINLVIKNMGNKFSEINYEVRDKNTLRLIERTRVAVATENYNKEKDETRVRFAIQNKITKNTTY